MTFDNRVERVHKIEFISSSVDVYDISVDGNHNYYADNYLVHNKNWYVGKYKGDDAIEQARVDADKAAWEATLKVMEAEDEKVRMEIKNAEGKFGLAKEEFTEQSDILSETTGYKMEDISESYEQGSKDDLAFSGEREKTRERLRERVGAGYQAQTGQLQNVLGKQLMTFAEQEAARVAKGEAMMSDMLTKGFLISAAGGNPDKFFDRGLEVMKQTQAFQQDKQFADVVTAVYKKGDMPKNARDAYERLAPLVGPETAAFLSGHQLGMEEGKTQQERLWNKIIDIAGYDMESAVAELGAAWGTGRFKPAPVQTNIQVREKKARQMLEGVVAGGAGYAEGVTSIRPGIAASA